MFGLTIVRLPFGNHSRNETDELPNKTSMIL